MNVLALRPWLRLYRNADGRFLESVLEERAVPLDDATHDVLRALQRQPASSSTEILERLGRADDPAAKGPVHGALSTLRGLGLLAVGDEPVELAAKLAERTPALPLVDNVELTNICPMECVMCPTGTGRMTRPRGHMARAVFAKLVDELAPTKNSGKPIALHNLGESTLHPELAGFVTLAAQAGLTTELSANPGHVPLALFRALEDAGLSRLVLSLDGVDVDTLTAIRGRGANAREAFENVDAIFDHRRQTRRTSTSVVLQMIRQARNAAQAGAFLEKYASLAESAPATAAYVKEIDANTVEDVAGGGAQLYEIGRPRRPYLCRAPWRTVVVLWNGDVVACCHDANGTHVYGNLASSSLRELWASERVRGLRERLAAGTPLPTDPCGSCAHRPDQYTLPPLDDVPEEPLHW